MNTDEIFGLDPKTFPGTSPQTAFKVSSIEEAYQYLDNFYPWRDGSTQAIKEIDGVFYDIHFIKFSETLTFEVYFDISVFYRP